jgi:hypothetical protein
LAEESNHTVERLPRHVNENMRHEMPLVLMAIPLLNAD